jgi:hypothetical protein
VDLGEFDAEGGSFARTLPDTKIGEAAAALAKTYPKFVFSRLNNPIGETMRYKTEQMRLFNDAPAYNPKYRIPPKPSNDIYNYVNPYPYKY